MAKITKPTAREIIKDFAKVIKAARQTGAKPTYTTIKFRNEDIYGKERPVYLVPIGLLRFRKDNGRISSDVASYEKDHGRLDETLDSTQKILAQFLSEKDPEKTTELKNLILVEQQREPAIITSDGFLINGNRRKEF